MFIKHLLWGPAMLVIFLGVGLFYTICTGFFQFRCFRFWIYKTLGTFFRSKETHSSEISPFQAMSAALAGSMGIGNIAGVAAALTVGGPGAIFWMWISAFLGMMTKYAEILLGYRYRYRDEHGNWFGGPMVYLKEGLHSPFLSAFFSICCILGSLGMGNMTQGNSMASILSHSLDIPPVISAFVLASLTAFVIIGGMKRIASISSIIIPFISICYIIASLLVIFANITQLPNAFLSIFRYAFHFQPAIGGIAGYYISKALRIGITRGVFSNEAGLGSSVIAHAASSTENPATQGMWGIFEVFADTIIVCTITALVILVSGVYDVKLYSIDITRNLPTGIILASNAFSSVLGSLGESFVAFSTVIFAFASIIAWAYYGEQCVRYLMGEHGVYLYKLVYILAIIVGCVLDMKAVWEFADIANALMAVPNLLALIILSPKVLKDSKHYLTLLKNL